MTSEMSSETTPSSTLPIDGVLPHVDGTTLGAMGRGAIGPGAIVAGAIVAGEARAGEEHDLPNPATGQTCARVAWGDAGDVQDAVAAAEAVSTVWAAIPARERAVALRAIAADLRGNAEVLAELITMETGKRYAEASGEVYFSAGYFDWFADAATSSVEQHLLTEQRRFVVRREPVGVVAAVTPWNFPLSIPARKMAPALAAGCPAVLKPSELTPLSGVALVEIAGRHLPRGAVGAVVGDGEKLTTALIDHDGVAAVSFTGSTAVGTQVAQRAMTSMTRVTMELGGRAPFIVCQDADVPGAVESLMVAKFRNNGASCIAANNVFVHRSVYPLVIDELAARVEALRVGDPRDPGTELGPLLRPDHVARLRALVGEAERQGCRVWTGAAPTSGWYCAPSLVEAVPDSALWRQEVFGPVCVLRPFTEEEAVVQEVNGWRTGLGGYVMSADAEHALSLASRLRIGIVGVNNGAPNTPEVPFGGFGLAGLGREGGISGLHEFTEEQTISSAR